MSHNSLFRKASWWQWFYDGYNAFGKHSLGAFDDIHNNKVVALPKVSQNLTITICY